MSDTPIYDDMKNPQPKVAEGMIETVVDGTPNVVITNPDTRRKLTTILGVVGAALGSLIVADLASPEFDLTHITNPASAVFLFLGSYYGMNVTLPNTPTRKNLG